jgi:hypothetical protein
MRRGEEGEAVRLIQQALIDLGCPLPISTREHGSPDGIYGPETEGGVRVFQRFEPPLRVDGIVGKNTMTALDGLLPNRAPRLPPQPKPPMYVVPGLKTVIPQPTNNVCWAMVYTMMISWKDGIGYGIRTAVAAVGQIYANMFEAGAGMPPGEFANFLRAAGLRAEAMANLPLGRWVQKLRRHGLLWVGAMATTAGGLHSRIVQGVRGDGTSEGTSMMMIDPDGGVRYPEPFYKFAFKYERAIQGVGGTYFQIRHF